MLPLLSHRSRIEPQTVVFVATPPSDLPDLPNLLTAAEVARWLKTTVTAIYAKAERGTLPGATRLGRRLYFVRAELLRYVEQGRVPHPGGTGGDT